MREINKKDKERKIIIEEKSNSESKEYNSAKFTRRFAAYIIDIFLLGIIFGIFNFIIPVSEKAESINKEMVELQTKYLDKKITMEEYSTKLTPLNYEYSKETYVSSLISLVLTILYFVVYQYKNKVTLGKKVMGIKIVKTPGNGELQINDLIYRSLIVNSLFSCILTLSVLFLLKESAYTIASSYITIIQSSLILTTVLFMIIRKDKKSLHDIITNTKVVEIKWEY